MCNIIVRHCKNGELCNGSVTSNHTSCTFVNGGKICVHITGVTTTTGNFFTCSRHLTEGICIRRHVGKNNKNVKVTFIGKVFRGSESKTGCDDTLDGRIIGQVQEECCTLHGTTFFEIVTEETSSFHVDSHGTEDNGKVLFMSIYSIFLLHKRCLTCNLGCYLVVRKTCSRENGNLLSTSNGVHNINSRNTGLNHSLWIIARGWVDGLSVNVKVGFRKYLGC
mmetsp:Transcript_11489/g.16244  ORF Transcript_11489/g.16244 Transcript_11489/m.16244 type:complete len:222 (-) Transcript_11489:482-1147(-)